MRYFNLLQSILVLPLGVIAQQSPSIVVDKFDNNVSYRTNVCDRQRQLWDHQIELPDALRGLNLTVTMTNYQFANERFFFTLVNGRIKEENPGIFAVILDEVALRAGFEWRNSFSVFDPLNSTNDGDKTWTDILEWSVETFDISVEVWGRTTARMSNGISFPAGWFDSSGVLVEQYDENQSQRVVNLWSFLDPFSSSVWFLIWVAIVVTGFLYWFLEYLDVDADERDLDQKPLASIFYAALTATGHFEYRPKTHAARILGFSWTFWVLIVGSAYTANMASFLVSPHIDVFRVSTINAALEQDASICVQAGAVVEAVLKDKYPDLKIVPKEGSEQEIFDSLRLPISKGGCDAAAHQFDSFRSYQRSKNVNFDCTISSEGYTIVPIPAGMATKIDTGLNHCTSLISHVLDYHLTSMIADGFVETAMLQHLNTLATMHCAKDLEPPVAGGDSDDTFSLGLQDVGGIFILHAFLTVLSVTLGIFQFFYYPSTGQSKTLSEVFGIHQARNAIQRRREAVRLSFTAKRQSTCTAGEQSYAVSTRHTLSAVRAEFGEDGVE